MTLQTLLAAMVLVESGGDDSAIGDHGRAHGCLQIQKACIEDVNHYTGTNYSLSDAHHRKRALAIAEAYMRLWATKRRLGHDPTAEDFARTFHDGPTGFRNPHSKTYWAKVQKHLPK